jgi:hypothetical protein
MTRLMILAMSGLLFLPIAVSAGQSHAIPRSSPVIANSATHRGVNPIRPVPRRGGSRHPTIVILPHASGYDLPPTGVVTSPYFCVFHNEAFVSRIGMIDHLSSMHGVPLTTVASLCPDANGNCIFPLY